MASIFQLSKWSGMSQAIVRCLLQSRSIHTREGFHETSLKQNHSKKKLWPLRLRHVAPTMKLTNKLYDRIEMDNKLRHGRNLAPRRSDFVEWDYNTELIAFQARISEAFDDTLLREAFLSSDFVSTELKRLEDLGMNQPGQPCLKSNQRLADLGAEVLKVELAHYIESVFPLVPGDCVQALVKHLTSDAMLAHISFHIGTKDLIQTREHPPSASTMKKAFLAIVGALEESCGRSRSRKFVLDLVAAQLHGLDITDVWDLKDAPAFLEEILHKKGMGKPEARLLWDSGKTTILACFIVGIYADKKLIGQAAGESVGIAEEMAAKDALRRLLQFDDASGLLSYSPQKMLQ